MATRQIYWNIEGHFLLYLFLLIAVGFFAYGVYRRVKLWQMGQPENRWQNVWQGIQDVLLYGFFHKRIMKEKYPGSMHLFIFWGFVFLAFATAVVAVHTDLGVPIYQGGLYLFVKCTANFFGLLAVCGILMAAWRRYVIRPRRLDNKPEDGITLALIFLILLTGFLLESARIAATADPWADWAFVGKWLSAPLTGLDAAALLTLHRCLWWFHMLLVMSFIAYFPYSKLFHIILAPLNQFFRYRGPVGVPAAIDFEDESLESYGKDELQQFSWKTLFNSDVCLRCGRCQEFCPAFLSGKHLNPKAVIQAIKVHMEEIGRASAQQQTDPSSEAETAAAGSSPVRSLIGEVIPEEDIWACTTCHSCEQQCPVFVEHVGKTIELRRHLVLMESRFPAEAQAAFRNMENNGNPWGICWSTRDQFLKSLGVPTYEENPAADVLYWPGCSGAFDCRNQKVSKAVVHLLQAAGVNFAVLGNEEKCCGDSARRLGNEYLFYSLASENIEAMKRYGVKTIVTQCPHCFNILKNEYPQLGGHFTVFHHTEFLLQLVKSGQLTLQKKSGQSIAYHDSCYLGRYNQIYQPPRELLTAAGLEVREMSHAFEKSFCCGAGGGRMWLEEKEGDRINVMRAQEALATNPDLVGTACPFCLSMLDEAVTTVAGDEKRKTMDIAEILEQHLSQE
ncbi:MAG: heterodisulfide reductase-related iron-sulfur binding cluster [Veillonellales bacterium]